MAIKLENSANELAKEYSDSTRPLYTEPFKVEKIIALSGDSAAIIFRKKSGILTIALALYNKNYKYHDGWKFHFPTDGHVIGMAKISEYKAFIERENYKTNVKERKNG